MTELAARQQRRLDAGAGLRGAMDGAVWPIRRAAWRVEESVLWRATDVSRNAFEAVRWPFERLGWGLERQLLWPLQDAFRSRGALAQMALGAAVATAVAAAIIGAALITGDSGPGRPGPAPTVTVSPATDLAAVPQAQSASPTLQGAAPNFRSSPAEADAGEAATTSGTAGAEVKLPPSSIPPAPGGETHALRTARDFAAAFVLYEIGREKPAVRRIFARTATPPLAKALRERPPRLPGEVDVPKARVANVVLGERQRKQVDASVSLLRLGNVSELRLTLTKDRKQGWAVSEVRG